MVIGRPRGFDRQAAIDVAVEMFWRKGYAATSVAELCKAMGIFSPSFYSAFGSKEAFYVEVLERYRALRGPMIWDVLERSLSAREGVEAVLNNAVLAHTDPDCPPGCLVILSTAESDGEIRLGELVVTHRAEIFDLFRRRLERAVAEDELDVGCKIDDLARLFSTLEQGIALQARDGIARATLQAMVRATMRGWPSLIAPAAAD